MTPTDKQSLPIDPASAKAFRPLAVDPGASAREAVALIYNPKSGRGRGPAVVASLARALGDKGLSVRAVKLQAALADPDALRGLGSMVVVGGDGTVRALASCAIAGSIPIVHYPTGTENLFAREFGMTRDPARLAATLRSPRVERVDVALLDGEPFVLMAGFGPDADVVSRLQARRRGAITHASYVIPILQTLARPRFRRLAVVADGATIIDGERGLLVVANCQQYGARLDPARGASMRDARLDVVFMPAASRARALAWAAACRLGVASRRRGFVRGTAERVEVKSLDGALSVQVDGEPVPGERDRVEIVVRPGVLPVLMPPG